MNYFELFCCDVDFNLNESQLKAIKTRFYQLQKQFHPDRFTSLDETQQLKALQKSSMVNEGYKKLINPIQRGLYLLELEHQEIKLEQETQFDAAFLIQLMDWKEAQNEEAIQNELKKILSDYQHQMSEAFMMKNWSLFKQILKQSIMVQKLII